MAENIQISRVLWEKIIKDVNKKYMQGSLDKPVVYALYTEEHDHHKIIEYREIETVRVKGDYPDGDYEYYYPGIRDLNFYPPKGTGKWFSGTLVVVVGDGIELEDGDKKWMIRDKMDFRIKMVMDSSGQPSWRAYYIDFPIVSLELL